MLAGFFRLVVFQFPILKLHIVPEGIWGWMMQTCKRICDALYNLQMMKSAIDSLSCVACCQTLVFMSVSNLVSSRVFRNLFLSVIQEADLHLTK